MARPAPSPPPETESPEKRKARIEGIRKLIQQASSPHGDGQQAAVRACALIRKFGLDIVDPSLLDAVYAENHQLKVALQAAQAQQEDDDEDDDFGSSPTGRFTRPASTAHTWSSSFVTATHAAPPRTTAAPRATPPPPPAPPAQPAAPVMAPVYVAHAQFAGRCKQCGKTHQMGDPIRWIKAVGIWCPTTTCFTDWHNKQQSAARFNPFGP